MELLETLGVPVIGYGVDTMPLFYNADGGPPVSARVDAAAEAARIADAHWTLGGNGLLVGQPPPESVDLEPLIAEAVADAQREGRHRPGGDAARARVRARGVRGRDREAEPRPDRRQRRPRRRDRSGARTPVSLYDAVRDLPLADRGLHPRAARARHRRLGAEDDGDPPLRRRRDRPGRGRHLRHRGAGRADRARRGAAARRRLDAAHVLAAPGDARALRRRARRSTPTSTTAAGRSRAPRSTSRSARPAARSPQAVGREPRPLTFVTSGGLGEPPTTARIRAWLDALPLAPLQARRQAELDGRDPRRAGRARLRRLGRPQGPVRRHHRRHARRRRLLPARRRGAARGVDRGPGPHARRRSSCSSRSATASPGTRRSTRSPTSRRSAGSRGR